MILGHGSGGWGGIRTHGGLAPAPVFKTGALNHSATHPDHWSEGRWALRTAIATRSAVEAPRTPSLLERWSGEPALLRRLAVVRPRRAGDGAGRGAAIDDQ